MELMKCWMFQIICKIRKMNSEGHIRNFWNKTMLRQYAGHITEITQVYMVFKFQVLCFFQSCCLPFISVSVFLSWRCCLSSTSGFECPFSVYLIWCCFLFYQVLISNVLLIFVKYIENFVLQFFLNMDSFIFVCINLHWLRKTYIFVDI